jgi:hypothetical protein
MCSRNSLALRFVRPAAALRAGLVHPVRRDAGLGHGVHLLRAHLELDGRAQRVDQRRVQRLVAVGLGDRDVVLEAARHRLVHLVQRAQRLVALGQRVDDDAEAEDVVDLREARVLLAHLAVDREHGLLAAVDRDLGARVGEGLLDVAPHAVDDVAPRAARALQRLAHRRIPPGVHEAEGQVLQLAVHLVQAQAVRDGGEDLDGLARDAGALGRCHRIHRAHVVQAVAQLDEDDAHVARHRQQHLAERLGLAVLAGGELQLVQLGQAVDQVGRRGAEQLDQLGFGDAAVLDGVVHQRRHQRGGVELPIGHQAGDRERVRDVGDAAGAQLAQVRLVGELVGLAHLLQVGLAQVAQLLGQLREGGDLGLLRHGRGRGRGARQRAVQLGWQQVGGERTDAHMLNLACYEGVARTVGKSGHRTPAGVRGHAMRHRTGSRTYPVQGIL